MIGCIIQARVNSQRQPGKILKVLDEILYKYEGIQPQAGDVDLPFIRSDVFHRPYRIVRDSSLCAPRAVCGAWGSPERTSNSIQYVLTDLFQRNDGKGLCGDPAG